MEIVSLFRRPRRGKYFCAPSLGQLNRSHANPAGCGVNQDALAGLHVSDVFQRIRRRQERDRDRRRLLKGQVRRLGSAKLRSNDRVTCLRIRRDGDNLVADLDVDDISSDCRDNPAAFESQGNGPLRKTRIQPQRLENVREVESRGNDLDLDFIRTQRVLGQFSQSEFVHEAVRGSGKPKPETVLIRTPPSNRLPVPIAMDESA